MTPEDIFAITRPDRNLLWVYLLRCLFAGPLFPVFFIPCCLRYHTLRYRFDAEGIGVSYGLLFRHESYVTYARIQDIHLSRGLIERWLGMGTVQIQTAAGSSSPEVSIVGLREHNELRDFLYMRMRGYKVEVKPAERPADGTVEMLTAIRDELRALRQALEQRRV